VKLGDAEGGLLPDGRLITFMETHKKAYSVKASTFRSLRIKGKVSE
jgi:hypothetical protein